MTQQLPQGFVVKQNPFALPEGFAIGQPQQTQSAQSAQSAQQERPQQPELTETQLAAQQTKAAQEQAPRGNLINSIAEMIKGKEAKETKDLPEIMYSGVFHNQPKGKVAKIAGLLAVTTDPMEMAKIIEAQGLDDIAITYNITEDRQPYPVITNRTTGVQAVLNKPGLSMLDIGQGVMSAAMFGNVASSIPKQIGMDALKQAAIETSQAAGGGDFSPEEIAISGAIGGGVKSLEGVGSAVGRIFKGEAPEETAAQIAAAESRGINLGTSDVIPPETMAGKFATNVGETIPVIGTGRIQADKQIQRQKILEEFTSEYQVNYDDIIKSLENKKQRVKTAAIKSRQNAVDQVKDLPLASGNTIDVLDNEIRRLTTLPNGQPRTNVDTGTLDMLEGLADDVIADERFINMDQLRTTLRQKFLQTATGGPAGVDKQVEKRVYSAMTKDMDQVVRDNLSSNEFRQWKRGNLIYGQEAQKLKKSKIKQLFNESKYVSSKDIDNQIFSVHDTSRKSLYNSLDMTGRKNARAAIINNLVEKASTSGGLSVNSFLTQAAKKKAVIKDFFKGGERREFEGLLKALDASKRSQTAAVETRTGQQAIPYITGASAIYSLGSTIAALSTAGLFARAYESRAVRNALLRLGSIPKGSAEFEKTLNNLSIALNSTLQTARQEGQ